MTTDNKTMLKEVAGFSVSDALINKVLTDNEVNPDSTYDPNNKKPFDLALADLYDHLIAQPDFQEGDFKRQMKPEQLRKMRDGIWEQYGLKPSNTQIDGTSIM